MASTYTNILRLELQADGENDGTWGQILNDNVIALAEDAIAATTSINTTGGTETLSTNQGSADQARNAMLDITGSLGSDALIEVPAQSKHYIVRNNTTGSQTVEVLVTGQSAGAGVEVQQGTAQWVYCDGSDVYPAAGPVNPDGTLPDVTISGVLDHDTATETVIARGTTAERPGSPSTAGIRFNESNSQFEGYNGSSWGPLGGAGLYKGENGERGDTVSGAGDIFRINEQTLNTDTTIESGENASCAGPLTIANGVTLTVNGNLTIV
jgi:hypothetical protein